VRASSRPAALALGAILVPAHSIEQLTFMPVHPYQAAPCWRPTASSTAAQDAFTAVHYLPGTRVSRPRC
jgi:hypothetical protein